MTLLESSLIAAGGLALLFLAAWVGYDEGKRQALKRLDEQLDVARMLGQYGITLRMESIRTGVDVDVLLERDGLNLTPAERSLVRRSWSPKGRLA